jgi:hypothetical protein
VRDPILSSLFVVALEVGISYLAAMRGIEYVRRLVWLQVVLCVAIASNVIPSNLYDFHLTGIYMSVLIGLVVADTELYIRGKREVLLTSARDSMSETMTESFGIPLSVGAHPVCRLSVVDFAEQAAVFC